MAYSDPNPVRLGKTLGSTDAFGRLRVSNSVTLFDSTLQYDVQPLLWNTDLVGAGAVTHLPNESSAALACGTASGDKVTRQTREYLRYQPGKSKLVRMTFAMGAGKANVTQRAGMFDANNGILLELAGTALNVTLRSKVTGSVVNDAIAQADWNIDKFDGKGISGITLDITKSQILTFDLEWLGVGDVTIGFTFGRVFFPCHVFKMENILTTAYMTTANLPLRYEIENTDTAATGTTLRQICSEVSSEGGIEIERAFPFSASTGVAGRVTVGTTELPLISIRPAAAFNSITNQMLFREFAASVSAQTKDIHFRIRHNATLTGASFAAVDGSSGMEADTTATATTSGTIHDELTIVGTGGGGKGSGSDFGALGKLPFGFDIDGTNPDILTITGQAQAAGGIATATLNWREIR
jgi:hypothetical protein